MNASMVLYSESIPADIAFVVQIDKNWNFIGNSEQVIEVAKGFNRDRHMFGMPSKYDIFFCNENGLMRVDGMCNEFVNGYELFDIYKFVIPIGTDKFVETWNNAFNIRYSMPFIRVPKEYINEKVFGCKTLLLTGRELRKKGTSLHGGFVSIRRISGLQNECVSHCVENKRKAIKKFLLKTFEDDTDNALFFVSHFIDWKSKWIVNVFNGEICVVLPASNNQTYTPNRKKIKEIIAAISSCNDKALPFSLTFGVTYDESTGMSETYLMEAAPINMDLLHNRYFAALPDIVVANYVMAVKNGTMYRAG